MSKTKLSIKLETKIKMWIDKKKGILYLQIGSKQSPSFSYATVCEFYDTLQSIKDLIKQENIEYFILKSSYKISNNLGCDIMFLLKCIRNNDKTLLMDYAYKCIKNVYYLSKSFETDAIGISILNDNAFGGIFEHAMATKYIVAEEHVKFGFPESEFGFFPIFGGYHFLTRKVGFVKADEIINSNSMWSTNEMKELNIITHIAKKGKGMHTVLEQLKKGRFLIKNPLYATFNDISSQEFLRSIDLWIDNILGMDQIKIEKLEAILSKDKPVFR